MVLVTNTSRSAAQLHDVAADVDALILWIGIHQTGVIEDEHVGNETLGQLD